MEPSNAKDLPTLSDSAAGGLNSENVFRLLIAQISDYAIFLLAPNGEIATWNSGAERIKGYQRDEIIGKHFRIFYLPEEQASGKPETELRIAAESGRFEDEDWRVRKDGSRFWANVIITPIRNSHGGLIGYGKVTRDLTERKRVEEQLRELSGRLLKMQDEDRGRLGRELHDTIGQYLAAAKMMLDGLALQDSIDEARAREQIDGCRPILDRALQELRTLSYLLYPPMLDETGLAAAIRWHIDGFSKRSGIQITHEVADVRLPRDVELALFRVFQESLANIHRHSGSQTAYIRFATKHDQALLEISDQGKGMRSSLAAPEADPIGTLGVGLRGMHERIRQLNGKLEITSSDKGTTVTASVPLKSRQSIPIPS